MLRCELMPRFYETDGLGHINNTVIPKWFETARTPIFAIFNPSLRLDSWNLILRKIDVEFLAQTYLEYPVEVRSWISHVGSSSFVVSHELWQRDTLTATGSAVMVYFDYQAQEKQLIPDHCREALAAITAE
ncbi:MULTISPECIES: acyl-CoA thioesterase [Spongiibacter]|uniref:acyl-CoA thioesterase n=1 Tax=Spongiibacter TaxID=630749 RepID=UPI0003B38A93|nr:MULTISPECIES: thioesterase family protein [Spongiibacter]MBO6752616.1 acyl-CoA thioesterase [Spongiibacter sp.]|tara:strand:+ start:21335 stop:21727 length:393 start_codon:yes stop_codon:yes gene_type:complete